MEQVFADVTSGPLAHMPSEVFAANAAWLSIAAMAHNLVRAAGALASLPFAKARAATIRRDLIAVAARAARHGAGPHHPAPARRLAPRAGMAEPVDAACAQRSSPEYLINSRSAPGFPRHSWRRVLPSYCSEELSRSVDQLFRCLISS